MDGVQFVLHNPQYTVDYTWGWSALGIVFGIISLISLLCVIIGIKDKDYGNDFFLAVVIAIFFGGLAFIECSIATPIETFSHSEYVVVVHEGVDCKEFLEKYEVVEQNGDLITIKEREIENDNT